MIRASNLTVRYGSVEALHLLSLEISKDDRVAVIGGNGTGKSTLLRLFAGLLTPTTGELSVSAPPGRTVLVHQHPYLFRGTVEQNMAYALKLAGHKGGDVSSWLEQVGAAGISSRPAQALSGGERRRVAVARALCTRPEILLLDEPFAGLDPAGIEHVTEAVAEFSGTLVMAGPELEQGSLVHRTVRLEARALG